MRGFLRLTTAALLLFGVASAAQAQSQRSVEPQLGEYQAVATGRSVALDRPAYDSGTVTPSENRTVMGLRVPR